MPLPLLLLAPAAASTTSTAAIITAVSAVAIDVTAIGTGIWYFFFKKEPLGITIDHEASLRRQRRRIERRINDARDVVTALDTTAAVEGARVALSNVAETIQHLQSSAEVMAGTSHHLEQTSRVIQQSSEALATSIPPLAQLADRIHDESEEVVVRIEALHQQLGEQQVELSQAKVDIKELTETVHGQAATIVRLTGALETLTVDNGHLKATIQHQDIKYKKLETAAIHADQNHRLFKKAVQESTKVTQDKPYSPTLF